MSKPKDTNCKGDCHVIQDHSIRDNSESEQTINIVFEDVFSGIITLKVKNRKDDIVNVKDQGVVEQKEIEIDISLREESSLEINVEKTSSALALRKLV